MNLEKLNRMIAPSLRFVVLIRSLCNMGKIIFVLKCVLIAFCFYGRTRVYESFKLPIFMGFMVCDLVI